MNKSEKVQRIRDIVKLRGIIRARDLDSTGIPREDLSRLCKDGFLQRVGRGLYTLPDADVTEHHSFAQAAKRIPKGVICLLSALRFHGITTQMPFEVWMAIEKSARCPKIDYPVIRFVRFSGSAFKSGIEEHNVEGVIVKIYSAAKTVVDCFKYRNKIGMDIAIEALRDCRRDALCSVNELWHFAQVCRMTNVMKPYLESII